MKTKTLALVLIIALLFSAVAGAAEAPSATENYWITKRSLPQTKGGFRVAVVNGKIYAMVKDINYEYDPAKNTWTSKKPMPTARDYFGIAVCQNKIYVIGGRAGWDNATGYIASGANEVYDPATNTWETKKPMPTNRSDLNANVVDGKIYLVGGRESGPFSTVALNEVYDVASDSWTTKKPIPYPVVSYASAVVDGKVYVIGGQDEFLPEDVKEDFNQIYDPETDTWSLKAPLPTVVENAAAGATTGTLAPKRIYVIGGLPEGSIEGTNVTQVYDPAKDTWSFGAPMPTARAWLAVAVVNDVLYAIGGSPQLFLPFLTKNERYTPIGYGAIKPVVSVLSPENKTYNVNSVSLTFTVDKPVSLMKYCLDAQDNVSLAGNTTLTGLPNGTHNLTVYAKYTQGIIGASENIAFTIAKPEPEPSEPFPIALVTASAVSIAVIGVGLLVYLKKRTY